MRLLVTRPEPDAGKTALQLQKLGHETVVSPLLNTIFSDEPLPWQTGMSVAVTSRNGARAVVAGSSSKLPADTPIYTVGNATRNVLTEAGFSRVYSADGKVDDLATLISADKPENVLYVCGRDRVGDLEYKLETKGIPTPVHEAYRTEPAPSFSKEAQSDLEKGRLDGVLIYSVRTAKVFLSLLQEINLSYSTKKIQIFCLANSIASVFDRADIGAPLSSESPNEEALLRMLDRF